MKVELLIIFVTIIIIANIYYDNQLFRKLKEYKKYYKISIVAFVGICLYLLFKKSPKDCANLLISSNNYIKHIPIDNTSRSFVAPLIDFTSKTISSNIQQNYPNQNYNLTPRQQQVLISGNKTTKRSVSETKKKYVAANQNWRCKHCNIQLSAWFEVDHVVKLQYGGSNNIENLEALCRECHGKKTAFENL